MVRRNNNPGDGDNSCLGFYHKELRKSQVLSREEEIELAEMVRRGDQKAIEKLAYSNLKFSYKIALKYKGVANTLGINFEDVVQDANLGLVKALARYDSRRGVRFISFAVWWMRQSILQGIAYQSRISGLPYNVNMIDSEILKMSSELEQELGREVSDRELSEYFGISEEYIERLSKLRKAPIPLQDDHNGDGKSLVEKIGSDEPSPDDIVLENMKMDILKEYVGMLPDREATAVTLYYGLFGEEKKTLEEIGKIFGFSRERARQIKKSGLERLIRISKLKKGRRFVEYANEF